MELEKAVIIHLSGPSLTGPVTIEGVVGSKDPNGIRIAELSSNVTYAVKPDNPIRSITALDADRVEFVYRYQAKVDHGYLYWDDVISRYGHAFIWITEHCDEMTTMNLSVNINDSVILQCVVVYEAETLAEALEQASSLSNEIAHRFRVI